jgi:urea transporter
MSVEFDLIRNDNKLIIAQAGFESASSIVAMRRITAFMLIWLGLIITPIWAAVLGALVWSLIP